MAAHSICTPTSATTSDHDHFFNFDPSTYASYIFAFVSTEASTPLKAGKKASRMFALVASLRSTSRLNAGNLLSPSLGVSKDTLLLSGALATAADPSFNFVFLLSVCTTSGTAAGFFFFKVATFAS